MTNLASTVWRPTSGIGESGQSDEALLTAQNDVVLCTQDGVDLRIQSGSYTRLAATEWVESEGE